MFLTSTNLRAVFRHHRAGVHPPSTCSIYTRGVLFNDPSFDAQHATPVLYVHGINSRTIAFRRNARLISSHGHWVWGYDYGRMLIPLSLIHI